MESFIKLFTGVALFVIAVLVRGWTVMTLWHWFIVPTFATPELRFIPAVGMSLLVGVLASNGLQADHAATEEQSFFQKMLETIFLNLIAVGSGYIYTLFQ